MILPPDVRATLEDALDRHGPPQLPGRRRFRRVPRPIDAVARPVRDSPGKRSFEWPTGATPEVDGTLANRPREGSAVSPPHTAARIDGLVRAAECVPAPSLRDIGQRLLAHPGAAAAEQA